MYIYRDFISRQIFDMLISTLQLMFELNEEDMMDEFENLKAANPKYGEWAELVESGELLEAEADIMENLTTEDMRDLEMALLLYAEMNKLSDEELEEADMVREDLRDSVRALLEMFECGGLGDALLLD